MKVGQFSESDAVGALRMSVYSSRHASESHRQSNQFDLRNKDKGMGLSYLRVRVLGRQPREQQVC